MLAAALDALSEGRDPDVAGRPILVDDTLGPTKSYDEKYVPPPGRSADMVSMPNGRKVYRPQIETLAAETFDDWIAHTEPIPAPRDLTSAQPVGWFSRVGSKDRDRSSNPSMLIELSDVGFSLRRDQALLQAARHGEGSSSGFWLLLQRQDDRWVVVQRRRTFIACGPPPANITPVDR